MHKKVLYCQSLKDLEMFSPNTIYYKNLFLGTKLIMDILMLTGAIYPVEDTDFDLRKPVNLGSQIAKLKENGFDHNFCLKESQKQDTCAR